MKQKYDRLYLRDQFCSAGHNEKQARSLANTIFDLKQELEDMITDAQRQNLIEFRRDSELRLAEQRREFDQFSSSLTKSIETRMKKDILSLCGSIVLAGIAVAVSIFLTIHLK